MSSTLPPTTPGVFFLPVRERPHRLAGVLARCSALNVIVLLDEDDPFLSFHRQTCDAYGAIYLVCPPNSTTAQKLNLGFQNYSSAAFYGFLADDLLLPTDPNWAETLIADVPPFGLNFCSDGFHGERLPTHPILGGELVRALGFMAYPRSAHNGIDCIWFNLASTYGGCYFIPTLRYIHLNPACTTTVAPDSINARAKSFRAQDDEAYNYFFHGPGRLECMKRVEAYMEKYGLTSAG